MRRRRVAAALAGLVALAPGVAGGEGLVVSLDAGVVAPAAPPEFPDFWRTGWSVGGGVAVPLAPLWEAAVGAHFHRFPADESAQKEDLLLTGPGGTSAIESIDGRDMRALALAAELRFHPRTRAAAVSPYLAFGAGFFSVSTTEATVVPLSPGFPVVTVPGDTDSALAATLGGGVRWRATERTFLGVESIYTIGFTEKSSTEFLPLRIGVAREL